MDDLKSKLDNAISTLRKSSNLSEIQNIKVEYLGKSGILTQEMRKLQDLPPEQKKEVATTLNQLKTNFVEALEEIAQELSEREINLKISNDVIDVTLPTREKRHGKIHLISNTINEVVEIFGNMGFGIEYGHDIENELHNFDALNFPKHHPAKQSHDTFYMKNRTKDSELLRTQTSTVQIHAMRRSKPPFKFISLGRVYRKDSDQTHTPMFHQVEGVYIDKNIDMGHLKGCLEQFLHQFFNGIKINIRFRPHFFPFTEPSAEVDISIGDSQKYLEILGCGMVHPKVLQNVGIDPNEYQGFAFGMGIERITMLKHNINDLRTFFEGDARLAAHHGKNFYNIPKLIWGLSK